MFAVKCFAFAKCCLCALMPDTSSMCGSATPTQTLQRTKTCDLRSLCFLFFASFLYPFHVSLRPAHSATPFSSLYLLLPFPSSGCFTSDPSCSNFTLFEVSCRDNVFSAEELFLGDIGIEPLIFWTLFTILYPGHRFSRSTRVQFVLHRFTSI